jgi:cytochrome bd-type quinol oxidase subunit 2
MQLITALLRSIHISTACLAAAGPLLAAWLHSVAARGNDHARQVGLRIVTWSLISLAVALGAGLLLGFQNHLAEENYGQLLAALRAKMEWGIAELFFSVILIVIFWRWWQRTPQLGRGRSLLRCTLAVLAATNLLYHFPLLFAVMDQLRTDPSLMGGGITSSEFRQLIIVPIVYTKAIHVILAGVALACLAIMIVDSPDGQESTTITTSAARILLVTLLLQLVVGIWMLMVMPPAQRDSLIGMAGPAPWLLALAVILWVALNQAVIPIAGGEKSGSRPRWLLGIMFVLLLVMSMIATLP